MNKKCTSLSIQQYSTIIDAMLDGWYGHRPNPRCAAIISLLAMTGESLRAILLLEMCDFSKRGEMFIVTFRERSYELRELHELVKKYLDEFNTDSEELAFDISAAAFQRHLRTVCEFLGFTNIGSISFKQIYRAQEEYRRLTNGATQSAGIHSQKLLKDKFKKDDVVPGIYSIRCKKNGMVYVGKSENIFHRWDRHLDDLRCGEHNNGKLQNDFIRFGEDAFVFNILSIIRDPAERTEAEKNFIYSFGTIGSGYNISA